MSFIAWLLLTVVVLVTAAVVTLCVARARRLDRLHVRLDAARHALIAALNRRAEVALRIDAGAEDHAAVCALKAAATAARTARWEDREPAENTLGHRLAEVDRSRLPADLAAELTDAEQLVVLARRVHNDAVRDTLELRSRRLVRWFRLAGGAPTPQYFEIADPTVLGSFDASPRPPRSISAASEPGVGTDVRSG